MRYAIPIKNIPKLTSVQSKTQSYSKPTNIMEKNRNPYEKNGKSWTSIIKAENAKKNNIINMEV